MIGFFHHARSTWKLKQILLLTWSTDRISFALVYAVEMENQGMVKRRLFKWNIRRRWAHRDQEKCWNNFKDFKPVVDYFCAYVFLLENNFQLVRKSVCRFLLVKKPSPVFQRSELGQIYENCATFNCPVFSFENTDG